MNLQDLFESTGDAKFDAMIKSIKQGTKKQATADRREREAQSRERARDAFGASPADQLSVRGQDSLREFAPDSSGDDGGDDGFSEETLKKFAAQWYNGNEDPQVEKTLMAAGWEIGQDEGYDDEPGVFVVQAGDINGHSFISWPANELRQGVSEGIDPYRLERLDPQTRRVLIRMGDHKDPGSWLSASEAYAMMLGLQYKNRDPRGWEQEVQHYVDLYRQYSGRGVSEGSYTTEKQILTRIRQIMHDRKLSGTDSNAGELLRLRQQLKDLRSEQGVSEGSREHGSAYDRGAADSWYGRPYNPQKYSDAAAQAEYKAGYDENESQASMRKDYDDDRDLDQDRDQLDEDGRTVEVVVSDGTKRYQRRVRVGTNTKNLESSIVKYYQKLGLPVISIDGKKVSAAVAETNDSRVCPECGGPIFKSRFMAEEQDACYRKVKSRYKVWPSAYASGALVQCRKKGAANWGNKSK